MPLISPIISNSPFLPAKQHPESLLAGNALSQSLSVANRPHFRGDKTDEPAVNKTSLLSHKHQHATHDVFDASAQSTIHSQGVTGHQHDHPKHRHDHHHEHPTTKNPLDAPPKGIVAFFVQFFKRLKANFAMIFTGRSPEADSHAHHHEHAPGEACDHDHYSHEKTGVWGWLKDFGKILQEDLQLLLKNDDAPPTQSHAHPHSH